MPVKDFILLVVYLLVLLASNFTKRLTSYVNRTFRLPQMKIERKPICQRIPSVARLTFVEWRSALKKEKN